MAAMALPAPAPGLLGIERLSVSALDLHERCPRAWFYKYRLGKKPPPSPGQERGSWCHEQLEAYARGQLADLDYSIFPEAKAARPFYYAPRSEGIGIEEEICFEIAGLPFVAYEDVVNRTGRYLDSLGRMLLDSYPEIADYKFNKSPKFWKTGSDLKRDLQMLVYARAWFPRAPYVRLSHVCHQTTKPHDAAKVTVLAPWADIEAFHVEVVEPAVARLKATAALTDVNETPVKLAACSAFGGCAYAGECTKRMSSEEIMSDLLQSLLKKQAPNNGLPLGVTLPPAAAVPTINLAPAQPAASAVAPVVQPLTQVFPPIGSAAAPVQVLPATPVTLAPVQTPEQQQRSATVAAAIAHANALEAQAISAAQHAQTVTAPASAAPTAAPETFMGEPITPVAAPADKPKRGRKKAADAAPAATGETEHVASNALRLFVDVGPSYVLEALGCQSLDGYLAQRTNEICQALGVPDIRLGMGHDSPLSFGRWKGVLAAAIRQAPPAPGDYVINGAADELKGVLVETLAPMAEFVARGA